MFGPVPVERVSHTRHSTPEPTFIMRHMAIPRSFDSLGAGLLALLAGCAWLALTADSASAEVPDQLQHQGRLLNDQGEPVSGTKTMTFAIYGARTGGALVWESQEARVELGDGGFYSISLGSSSNPIDASVLEGGARWIEITVDGETMSPRIPLDSTPYATLAGKAESVADGAVDTDGLADGLEIDWSKLSNTPDGLDDGDNDTMGGLSCQQGYVARYDGSGWECAELVEVADQQCGSGQVARGIDPQGNLLCVEDADTTLSESEVDQFVSNNGYAQQSTLSNYAQTSNLASVATSGQFGDLQNVPQGLSDGDDVDDGDADASNELQSITKSGDTLSLSQDGATVDLSAYKGNTDDQTLSEVLSQGNDAGGTALSNVGKVTAQGADLRGQAIENASNVCDRTFASCREIDEAGCGSSSGTYQIDPDGQGTMQVYCDMEGGWTFTYVDNGTTTDNIRDPNDCRKRGLMLFTPVSKPHYDAAVDYLKNELNKSKSPKVFGPLGIYSPVPGENFSGPYNWDNACNDRFMTSHHYVPSRRALNGYSGGRGPCPFTSIAGDRFWTSDTNHGDWDTEPNGDYYAGSWLKVQGLDSNWYVNDFNDGGSKPYGEYSNYLCMSTRDTNLRVVEP